jgi:stearoyl-CoA desaturase (delta-9 desaturase)
LTDWDPSKWAILAFHHFGLATKLRRAKDEDINDCLENMRLKDRGIIPLEVKYDIPTWTRCDLQDFMAKENRCLVFLDGYIVDTTSYLSEHVSIVYVAKKELLINIQ